MKTSSAKIGYQIQKPLNSLTPPSSFGNGSSVFDFGINYSSLTLADVTDLDWLKLDNGNVLVSFCVKDLVTAQFDLSATPVTIAALTKKKWNPNNQSYSRTIIMKNVVTPGQYFLVSGVLISSTYRIVVNQNVTGQEILTNGEFNLTANATVYQPFIVNHPLSTKLTQRITNYTGKGLYPANKFDDFFLYADGYGSSPVFKLCLRGARSITSEICSLSYTNLVIGVYSIPQTSSVLVVGRNSSSSLLRVRVFSINIKTDLSLEIIVSLEYQRTTSPIILGEFMRFYFQNKNLTQLSFWGLYEGGTNHLNNHLDVLNGLVDNLQCAPLTHISRLTTTPPSTSLTCSTLPTIPTSTGCTQFISALEFCTKCISGKELMITWTSATGLPNIKCVPICSSAVEYLDTNDVC